MAAPLAVARSSRGPAAAAAALELVPERQAQPQPVEEEPQTPDALVPRAAPPEVPPASRVAWELAEPSPAERAAAALVVPRVERQRPRERGQERRGQERRHHQSSRRIRCCTHCNAHAGRPRGSWPDPRGTPFRTTDR
ncbi:MAG TPA: hypothetical protein VEZ49_01310 [Gemmatimonadales bacterium]|nr:hypothetical protein [Gemmatimonadales bacterium]